MRAKELIRLSRGLFDLCLQAHPKKRKVVIIDVDEGSHPWHTTVEHVLWILRSAHAHPLLVFDGVTGFPMAVVLRAGNSHSSKGAVGILRLIIKRIQQTYPQATILVRGEMENRIKELKNGLAADRLSCHRFLANQFRLLLQTFACCLPALVPPGEHLVATPFNTQADTLRLHLLKIGARAVETTRRVGRRLASGYPWRELLLNLVKVIRLAPA